MYKKSIMFLSVFILCLSLSNVEAKKLKVITTLPSLASITKSVGGEYIDVSSISKGSQDAHYIEAKPSYMVKLNKADLLIYSGLELEIGWLPLLIQGARNPELTQGSKGNLNASLALTSKDIIDKPRGEVDRSMGDVHPAGNPHYLLYPGNAISVARLVAERLEQLDPTHQNEYQNNLNAYISTLEEKIKILETKAAGLKGKKVICYHPDWNYMLNWLQIESVGYIELRPGIPPTPKHKREICHMMQEREIGVVLVSTWKEPTIAKEVAKEVNADLLILPGEVQSVKTGNEYIAWIEGIVEELVASFENPDPLQRNRHHHARNRHGS